MDDNCESIFEALHNHALSLRKPAYNLEFTHFIKHLSAFFTAIKDVFVLFDDFRQLKNDVFLCSK